MDHPIEADDRQAVFVLCRSLTRPPFKQDRLERLSDRRFGYRMKRTFRDGTSAIVLSGVDLIVRLAAMVPRTRPRANVARRLTPRLSCLFTLLLYPVPAPSTHQVPTPAAVPASIVH